MRLSDFLITKPEHLKKGDVIGIVAPAWSFASLNFKKGVSKLKRLGFNVKYDASIFSKYWSMAGHDKDRAKQINQMFADKEVKAIFCAKAGYGSIRTIPYLDKEVIRKNPKIFLGYSDITILLEYLQRIANMVVFHGPVVSGEINKEMSAITLEYLLKNLSRPLPLGEVAFPNLKMIKPGVASGIMVGGNLSMIASILGTPYDIDTEYKILFLEDVGEDMEIIDNYFSHLKLAGKFKRIRGLVLGRMLDCYDKSGKKYEMGNIISDLLGDLHVPIISGFPSGHSRGRGANVTIPFGVRVTIDASKPSLIFEEAGVK